MLQRKWALLCLSLSLLFVMSFSMVQAADKASVTLTEGQEYASSDYIQVGWDLMQWTVTNTSNEPLSYTIAPQPIGWCGTVPSFKQGTVPPHSTITESAEVKPGYSAYNIRLHGESGEAELKVLPKW